jgi:hypothetical protein
MTFQGGGTLGFWNYAIVPVMLHFERREGELDFDESTFTKAFSDLSSYFQRDTVRFRCLAPLYNFTSDVEETISLQDGLILRRTTMDEIAQLLGMSQFSGPFPFFKAFQLKFSIELELEAPKHFGKLTPFPLPHDFREDIEMVVTVLRLLKSGNVSFDNVRVQPVMRIPGAMGGTMTSSSGYFSNWGGLYTLNGSDIESLKALWTEFRTMDLKSHAALTMALRRFNLAYGRVQFEDKLLDFMIAFEALLLKEGEMANTHKLAVRTARLLERSFAERSAIYREMSDFYGKRSTTVHGGSLQITNEMVAKVEGYLRRCIWEMSVRLKAGEGHNEILSHVDLD